MSVFTEISRRNLHSSSGTGRFDTNNEPANCNNCSRPKRPCPQHQCHGAGRIHCCGMQRDLCKAGQPQALCRGRIKENGLRPGRQSADIPVKLHFVKTYWVARITPSSSCWPGGIQRKHIQELKTKAEDALRAMGKNYAVTPVPPDLLNPPQKAPEGIKNTSALPVEERQHGPVDAANGNKPDGVHSDATVENIKRT